MTHTQDDIHIEQYRAQVLAAVEEARSLQIAGSGSKAFHGRAVQGEVLDARAYRGIVDYEPTELVITARAGTPLAEIEAALAQRGQMLAFEPPHFGAAATLGGCVASGLSGPRRAYAGALRDHVLGVRLLDGRGAVLNFGGRVMKNVAGYDVARLLAGSQGTLGLLLEMSLKVLPRPQEELTLRFEMTQGEAVQALNRWSGLSASCLYEGVLCVRLSGASAAVHSVRRQLGGELLADAAPFWLSVREQQHDFFGSVDPASSLWRLSLPATADALNLPGRQLIEWGGALRWLSSAAPAAQVRAAACALGGTATLFRRAQDGSAAQVEPFPALAPALLDIHRRLKHSFDPQGVFNRGRLYPEL